MSSRLCSNVFVHPFQMFVRLETERNVSCRDRLYVKVKTWEPAQCPGGTRGAYHCLITTSKGICTVAGYTLCTEGLEPEFCLGLDPDYSLE